MEAMPKPWSKLTERERENERERSRERMRRYRSKGRYGPDWAKYHRESRKILEASDMERRCYSCGTAERPVRAHHIDGNYKNNKLSNLAWCCNSCDSIQAYERKSAR